ncbi:MAG: hypothetical protein Q9159_007121 [Coniocarpon cinnabarinum]
MWALDRFSTHSTPAASPGRNSPTPRRSLQIQRPGLAPRTSSLSLYSNTSHSNLPSTARTSVSSGLKNQIYSAPPEDVEDPLAAFERLVGTTLSNIEIPREADGRRLEPKELTQEIDFCGQSLEEFVLHEERPTSDDSAEHVFTEAAYSSAPIVQFESERTRLEDLHRSIEEADVVLQSVEKHLASFQADLSKVSSEIESLQTRSTSLNAKLESRRSVEKLLSPHVEQIALSPDVVKKIAEGPIDETWTKALQELQARAQALKSSKEGEQSRAATDLRPLVDSLSTRAVERIRDYFAAKIKGMRSPNINAQVLQQNDFARFKSLFAFLAEREPKLSEEILQAYVNTMRWYYGTHFTRYRDALSRLRVYTTDKTEILGEDSTKAAQARSSNTTTLPTPDLFNLARRIDILRHPMSTALPASTAEETKTATHLEVPFLHYSLALLDNASSEYLFLSSFLPTTPSSPFTAQKISRALTAIFNPAFDVGTTLTKSLTSESYDALALLLCIRLTQHFAFTTQRRRIPTLDAYINATTLLLWPRFQQILDTHIDSLKRTTASLPSRASTSGGGAASAAFATLAGTAQPSSASTAPHAITQRFANLLRGILALSADARDDEPVGSSIARLRECWEAWVAKMAQGFGAGEKGRRERERFLQSNYGLVTAVLADGEVKGRLAEECRVHFEGVRGVVGG